VLDNYKKDQPQFKIHKSNLSFSEDKTLFEPVASLPIKVPKKEKGANNKELKATL